MNGRMNWLKPYAGRIALLSLVVLVSFIWHLPASWVFQQLSIEKQLPPQLALSEMSGSWWQGQTQLNWQKQSLGQVQWQWRPSALFTGEVAIDLALSSPQNQLDGQAVLTLDGVQLASISGGIKIANLAKIPALALLDQAQGEMVLKALSVSLPWENLQSPLPWPSAISGQVALVDFSAMGMTLPLVEVSPKLDDKGVTLTVNGRGSGWQLTGQTWLSHDRVFAHDLTLTANSPNAMPDWAGLMMRQTSPTQALLKARGRW